MKVVKVNNEISTKEFNVNLSIAEVTTYSWEKSKHWTWLHKRSLGLPGLQIGQSERKLHKRWVNFRQDQVRWRERSSGDDEIKLNVTVDRAGREEILLNEIWEGSFTLSYLFQEIQGPFCRKWIRWEEVFCSQRQRFGQNMPVPRWGQTCKLQHCRHFYFHEPWQLLLDFLLTRTWREKDRRRVKIEFDCKVSDEGIIGMKNFGEEERERERKGKGQIALWKSPSAQVVLT